MRSIKFLLIAGTVLSLGSPGHAAEALKFGSAPGWVIPRTIAEGETTKAPVRIVLSDQQIRLERGKTVVFSEIALKIQNPQGLAAGNVSILWQPSTDTVTVNKLNIIRAGKVIDVLSSGQTFTVVRRETNLEAAMLDGTLTGNIQPEGVQEGDIIDFATTSETSDPVLKGHAEATFAAWNGTPIETARASLTWPKHLKINVRQSTELPPARRVARGDDNVLELSAEQIEPLVPPKGAPVRFKLGRRAEATDFASWADLAALLMPLYQDAAVIPKAGPLRDEVEKIRASTPDPKRRAEQALALAQDRVRYVALLMGQGGYVPASAETTWSRRFGDCKGKTALLLAILWELGIKAEPVAVQSQAGDAIADRLPMISIFDHVLVRANIEGKAYWLDGTRTGDMRIDDIRVPNFGWGLPLVSNAALVRIVPVPLDTPEVETHMEVDASTGIYAPAPSTVETTLRGDSAVAFNAGLSGLTEPQQREYFRLYLKRDFDFIKFDSASYTFDKTKRELRMGIKGHAKLDWNGGYFHVPNSTVGFNPDFERPPGAMRDAPFVVDYPDYSRTVTKLRMPLSFLAGRQLGSAVVRETLAGVEYSRNATVAGDLLTIELTQRSLLPEVSAKEARSAEARLRALADEDVALPLPRTYRPTQADLAALPKDGSTTVDQLISRGNTLLNGGKLDEAIADFTKALSLDPKNALALADRAIAYVYTDKLEAAAKDLDAASAIDPANAVLNRARGLMAERKGDFNAAVAAYSKSLDTEPNNGFALGRRALAERALGKDDAALADADLALKESSGWTDLRVLRANILWAQGKRDSVAAEADFIVRENPQTEYPWVAAGRIYARVGMESKAMEAFDRALAIKSDAYVYLNRAQSRPSSDRAGRMGDLQTALTLKPDDVDTMAAVASEYAAAGDFKRALALYNQLVIPSPGFSEYDVMRAAVLHKAGRIAEATKILAMERRKAKTAADLNVLCWTKATAGIMLESALQDCRDALKIKPESGPYFDSLGMVLLRLGKFDEALAAYDQAIAKMRAPASYMGRAFAYARKRDKARAEADRAEALKLNPDVEALFAEYGLKL